MKLFRKFIRFLVALLFLVPFWIFWAIMDAFLSWLNNDKKPIVKIISQEHLNWLLWRG